MLAWIMAGVFAILGLCLCMLRGGARVGFILVMGAAVIVIMKLPI